MRNVKLELVLEKSKVHFTFDILTAGGWFGSMSVLAYCINSSGDRQHHPPCIQKSFSLTFWWESSRDLSRLRFRSLPVANDPLAILSTLLPSLRYPHQIKGFVKQGKLARYRRYGIMRKLVEQRLLKDRLESCVGLFDILLAAHNVVKSLAILIKLSQLKRRVRRSGGIKLRCDGS